MLRSDHKIVNLTWIKFTGSKRARIFYILFFTFALCNDAFNRPLLQQRQMKQWLRKNDNGKDFEGCGRGLNWGTIPALDELKRSTNTSQERLPPGRDLMPDNLWVRTGQSYAIERFCSVHWSLSHRSNPSECTFALVNFNNGVVTSELFCNVIM